MITRRRMLQVGSAAVAVTALPASSRTMAPLPPAYVWSMWHPTPFLMTLRLNDGGFARGLLCNGYALQINHGSHFVVVVDCEFRGDPVQMPSITQRPGSLPMELRNADILDIYGNPLGGYNTEGQWEGV